MADLTAQQKKDYARTLYLKDNLTQQEIADKVGVSRKTVNRWVTVEKWEEMRVGMTLTKEQRWPAFTGRWRRSTYISQREEGNAMPPRPRPTR